MQQITMTNAGVSAPVFLCGESGVVARHRFYLDVNSKDTEVTLQLSYEAPTVRRPQWFDYPMGKLDSDFAFEEFGVLAVRLRVLPTACKNVDVKLEVHAVPSVMKGK